MFPILSLLVTLGDNYGFIVSWVLSLCYEEAVVLAKK